MHNADARRGLALIGFAFGLFALVAQAIISVGNYTEEGLNILQALVRHFSYLTTLTNWAIVFIYFAALVRGQRWLSIFRKPATRATAASMITLVAVYYHLVLSADSTAEGVGVITDILNHYLGPLIYLAWFILYNRTGTLEFKKAFIMLLPGLIYLAYILMRGEVVGEYPYGIVNAGDYGYLAVAKGTSLLVLAVFVLNLLYVALDRSILNTVRTPNS